MPKVAPAQELDGAVGVELLRGLWRIRAREEVEEAVRFARESPFPAPVAAIRRLFGAGDGALSPPFEGVKVAPT